MSDKTASLKITSSGHTGDDIQRSRKKRERRRNLIAYSFIAPNFIGFAVFTLIPILFAFGLAFMEWDGNNPIKFVGLQNFKGLIQDKFFIAAFKNTIIYSVGTVPLTMAASLGLAIVLNQKVKGRGIFRTLGFFPYVASLVAINLYGQCFSIPKARSIPSFTLFLMLRRKTCPTVTGDLVLVMLILFSVWKYMGYYIGHLSAGLQGILQRLYEVGKIHGAK